MKRVKFFVLALVLTIISIVLGIATSNITVYPEWSYEAADGANLTAQIAGLITLAMYITTLATWNRFFHGRPWVVIKNVFTNYFGSMGYHRSR